MANILIFALRIGLMLLLLRLLSGNPALLAIPLSVGAAEAIKASALFLLLFSIFFRKLQEERGTSLPERCDSSDEEDIEVDEY